jgi:hypothetical protein
LILKKNRFRDPGTKPRPLGKFKPENRVEPSLKPRKIEQAAMADDHVFSLELADGSSVSDGIPSPTHVDSPREIGIHSPPRERRPLNDLHVDTALTSSSDETLLEDRTTVADFLRQFRCYALMPQSSKVLVLDTEIPLRSVFQALEENGSSPLIFCTVKNWCLSYSIIRK